MAKEDERGELIVQLNNDTNMIIRSMRKVIDVDGFIKCDVELLKKLHNGNKAIINVLDEIFANASTIDVKEKTMMTIEIPDWARIGKIIYVKDVKRDRGDDPNEWYKEYIIAYGYDGIFHQAHNCPLYYSKFSEYGKTIRKER